MKFGDERLPPRIWRKIDQVDGHWIWRGAIAGQPQARWKVGDKHKTVNVRRLIFDLDRPSGSEAIGARCRIRGCVAPGCLFAGTSAEIGRYHADVARAARVTCRLGHDLTVVGTYKWVSNGRALEHCRACASIAMKKQTAKLRRLRLSRLRGRRRAKFLAKSERTKAAWSARRAKLPTPLWAAPTNGAQPHA